MSTTTITGTINPFALTGTRKKIEASPDRVQELAAKGLTKHQIAAELKMCYTVFRGRLVNQKSFSEAWEAGARKAGTYTDKQRPKTLESDEGVIYLQKVDKQAVLPALKKRRHNGRNYEARKRVRDICDITGLDTNTIVKALERLVIHGKAVVHSGIVFTEYEACK